MHADKRKLNKVIIHLSSQIKELDIDRVFSADQLAGLQGVRVMFFRVQVEQFPLPEKA